MAKPNNPEHATPSTQLNLMSALREANLVSDKQGTRFTGQMLSNKVTEAIPELARATHGFPV
jgi:hypothetical protein